MAPNNTRRASGATRKPFIHETVSIGHDLVGTINETSRGFELFDDRDKYLHTVTTIHDARRTLFEHHRDQQEAAKA